MLTRLRDDEQGVAMIIAVSVSFVVLMLATVVVAQSIHSLDSSGYDRERLLSVNAAEAGTNQWYAYLQTTSVAEHGGRPRVQRVHRAAHPLATRCSRGRRRPPTRRSARSMAPTAPPR